VSAVQFTGTLAPNESQLWFTYGWPVDQDYAWLVMPTTASPGAPEVDWEVEIERASDTSITYWLTIKNLTGNTIDFEARYSPLG
jgi:hypothetical protein